MGLCNKFILALCTMFAIFNSSFSIIAPFLPAELEKKNVSSSLNGLIFSAYSMASLLCSPLVGMVLERTGRRRMLTIGLVCMVLANLAFALSYFVQDTLMFTICMFGLRIIQGMGGSAIQVSSYSLVSSVYSDHLEQMLAFLESSAGVGLTIGPVLGSALYSLGGFMTPFYFYAAFFLVFIPVIRKLMPSEKVKQQKEIKKKEDE